MLIPKLCPSCNSSKLHRSEARCLIHGVVCRLALLSMAGVRRPGAGELEIFDAPPVPVLMWLVECEACASRAIVQQDVFKELRTLCDAGLHVPTPASSPRFCDHVRRVHYLHSAARRALANPETALKQYTAARKAEAWCPVCDREGRTTLGENMGATARNPVCKRASCAVA